MMFFPKSDQRSFDSPENNFEQISGNIYPNVQIEYLRIKLLIVDNLPRYAKGLG